MQAGNKINTFPFATAGRIVVTYKEAVKLVVSTHEGILHPVLYNFENVRFRYQSPDTRKSSD